MALAGSPLGRSASTSQVPMSALCGSHSGQAIGTEGTPRVFRDPEPGCGAAPPRQLPPGRRECRQGGRGGLEAGLEALAGCECVLGTGGPGVGTGQPAGVPGLCIHSSHQLCCPLAIHSPTVASVREQDGCWVYGILLAALLSKEVTVLMLMTHLQSLWNLGFNRLRVWSGVQILCS